jgi:hypothetical protein
VWARELQGLRRREGPVVVGGGGLLDLSLSGGRGVATAAEPPPRFSSVLAYLAELLQVIELRDQEKATYIRSKVGGRKVEGERGRDGR